MFICIINGLVTIQLMTIPSDSSCGQPKQRPPPHRDNIVAGAHIRFVNQVKIMHRTGLYLDIALPTDILELVPSSMSHG